jgi:hypothetical protein
MNIIEQFSNLIIEQFSNLINPSTGLGAFLISLLATFVGGFFVGKATNIQKGKNVGGDMIQNSKVDKR